MADGERFDITFDTLAAKHEYLNGGLYLFAIDTKMESEDIPMLQAVASAKSVSIRFYTRNSSYDYELSEDEQDAFIEALAVYELLGGKLDNPK